MANIGEGAAWRVQQNKLETYLVGTVTDAPPSSALELPAGVVAEAGAHPGQPEPDPANTGTGDVTLTGTGYRGTNTPSIEIQVTDHAHIAANLDRITLAGQGDIFRQRQVVAFEKFAGPDPISGNRALVKLPRIAITRTHHDLSGDDLTPLGISENFALFTYVESAALGVNFALSATVEMPDGSWLLFCRATDTAHGNAPVLLVYRFAQWTDTAWQLIYGPTACPAAAGVAAVVVDGQCYLYLAANETEPNTAVISGRLYIYRFTGTTAAGGGDPGTLASIAGPVLLSTITTAATFAYNLAACPLRSGVFAAVNNNIGNHPTVSFGYSADQRTWGGSDERHGRFISIGDFASVFFDPATIGDGAIAGETVTDLKMADTETGWFCTDAGRLFMTADAGKSWVPQDSPVSIDKFGTDQPIALYALAVLDTSHILAFGHAGLILQTIDGETWKVLRYQGVPRAAIIDDAWVSGAQAAKDAITAAAVDLYCADWLTSSVVVCGGDKGYLFRSTDAGVTWTVLLHNGPGAYRSLTHLSTTLYVCGDWDANKRAGSRTWFLSIPNVTTTPGTPSYDGPASAAGSNMVAMTAGVDDWLFAVTSAGRVYRLKVSVSPEPWHPVGRVQSRCTDIVRLTSDPAQLFVITPNGVWRTTEATVVNDAEPQFFPQQTLTQQNQVGIWFDESNGIIAGRGVQRTEIAYDDRIGAALLPLDDGNSVIFACNNITQSFMEIWLITDVTGNPTLTLVDGRNIYDTALRPGGTYYADYGFPAATRAASGELIVTAGVGVFAPFVVANAGTGAGNGVKQYAIAYKKTATLVETGRSMAAVITITNKSVLISFTAAPTGYTTEIYRADGYGHPFYWIASKPAGQAGHTDDFTTAGAGVPNPMRPAPHQSGARVNPDGSGRTWVWPDDPSLPIPVGSIGATPSLNGADESRTIMAVRGGRLVSLVTTSNWIFTLVARGWQSGSDPTGRTHYAPIYPGVEQWLLDDLFVLIALPQPGDVFTIAPEYTYKRERIADESPSIDWRSVNNLNEITISWDRADPAIVAVLGPGDMWEADAFALFGTNFDAVTFALSVGASTQFFTTKTLTCVLETGTMTGVVGAAVLRDTAKHWVPDQWAPGLQQYYVLTGGAVYRILGSGENSLTIERPANSAALSGAYSIFGDRFFWDGTGSSNGDLVGSVNRFGRVARVVIPARPTADGYRRIGTAIIGCQTSVTVPTGAEDDRGRGYAWDSRWRPVTNTEEQTAQTGISRVRHFGRTGQLWTLPYENVEGWRRDQLLNPLLRGNRLRKAFAIVFDATNASSVRLVRLVDASEYAANLRDRYSWATALKEVV